MKIFSGWSFYLISVLLILKISPAQDTKIPDNITVQEIIVYASVNGYDLTLDLASPKNLAKAVPAIVHIHGGGWQSGRKNLQQAVSYAREGFVAVSIDYRLSGVAKFPAGVHDCKAAIRWVRANAKKYLINPDQIGVVGSSAGGHLSVLLGTSGGDPYLEGNLGNNQFSSTVQCVVDKWGPTDFLRMDDVPGNILHLGPDSPEARWIGGQITQHPDLVKKANPITYIDSNDPPILIIHGEADPTVIINQSELLYEALQGAGIETKFIRVKNAGHGLRPIPQEATISPSRENVWSMEIEWFKRILKFPE
jgi:acetyl esterase/lipase